jgi:23S rRNA U2552 (ribose-2'-O)-methylase RlmE/FtsJ
LVFSATQRIVGIDIDPNCKRHETERIKVEIGDQGDRAFLEQVVEKHGGFDIILDDGSHDATHQRLGFEVMRARIYYVIEDMIHRDVARWIGDTVSDVCQDTQPRKPENDPIEMISVYLGTALFKFK